MGTSDTQYKNLMSEMRGMREEIGRIDRDLATDRADIEDFKVQMSSMREEIKQLRHALNYNADKVKDSVRDSLQPAIKEVSKLKDEIKKKQTVTVTKESFWGKIRFQWVDKVREKSKKRR